MRVNTVKVIWFLQHKQNHIFSTSYIVQNKLAMNEKECCCKTRQVYWMHITLGTWGSFKFRKVLGITFVPWKNRIYDFIKVKKLAWLILFIFLRQEIAIKVLDNAIRMIVGGKKTFTKTFSTISFCKESLSTISLKS